MSFAPAHPTTTAREMRAAVMYGRGDIRVESRSIPPPGPNDVRLRVASVGICGTDAGEYANGPRMFPIDHEHPVTHHHGPMVPGHEFSGTVDARGADVTSLALGQLVASPGSIACGTCALCESGRTNLCSSYATVGLHRDGALAQYVVVPAASCFAVSSRITPDAAALAQPMAIAVHVIKRSRARSGDAAIVIGCGGIGAFLVFALAKRGVTVTAVDIDPARLTIALGLGATTAVLAGEALPAAPYVFEVSGRQSGFDVALAAVTTGGRVISVGLPKERLSVDMRDATLREIEIIGSNALVAAVDVPDALDLLARDPRAWSLIAPQAIPLDRIVSDGLRPLAGGSATAIKTLIDPWIETTRRATY